MRKYHRENSEILRKKNQSLSTRIKLRNIAKYPTILWTKTIGTNMDIWKFRYILNFESKPCILEAEKCVIYTFEKTILFLTSDATTGCDDTSLMIECDEYCIFYSRILCSLRWKIRKSNNTLLTKVGIECFSYECMHKYEILFTKINKLLFCILLDFTLIIFNLRKNISDWIRS